MFKVDNVFCRGLKRQLEKWKGKGFGSDVRKLQRLLDAGSAQEAEQEVREGSVGVGARGVYLEKKNVSVRKS